MTGSPTPKIQPTPTADSMKRASRAGRYTAGLVVVLVLTLGFGVWASAQPWFFYHAGDPYMESYGYSHRAYGLACDIVISGDSTAMADFVPSVIEERTGLKTCNVAEMRSLQDFLGTHYTLDDYLAHNPPPRFIVTGWTPGDLDLEHPPLLSKAADGFAYAMQYRRGPWLWHALRSEPKAALSYVIWSTGVLIDDTLMRLAGQHKVQSMMDERARRDAARGNFYVKAPAQTECEEELIPFKDAPYEQNAASVAEFRRHYTTPHTQVLIYVTPVASCEPNLNKFREQARGLGERAFEILPISDFNRTNVHLTPEASAVYSEKVSADILARMNASRGAPPLNTMPN